MWNLKLEWIGLELFCTPSFYFFRSTAFMVGRWNHNAHHRIPPQVTKAAVQKDEAIIPARFREKIKRLKQEVLR